MSIRRLKNVLTVLVILITAACTKVVVLATDHATHPVSKRYAGDPMTLYEKSKKVLPAMGYEIVSTDDYQYQITTGWRPVTSDSHYLSLFNRRDYAAGDGAYYQLILNVVSEGSYSRVDVKTNVQAAAGKLSSAQRLERDFLVRLDDAARSPQIQVTNVGVENR